MTQPKKNSKQTKAKATVKASPVRFGKKQRAEIIKQFLPQFEEALSSHLERESHHDHRLRFGVAEKKEIIGISDEELIKRECPMCERTPYQEYNYVHPNFTLTDQEANDALRKLGFEDFFIKEYIKKLSRNRTSAIKERKSVFGIKNLNYLICELGRKLRVDYMGISITAATLILEDLFTKNGYNPGEGTIKKYMTRYFNETPNLSIQNWDGNPDTTKQLPAFFVAPILHGYLPESVWGCPGDIWAINPDDDTDILNDGRILMFAPKFHSHLPESVRIYPDAILEARDHRIARIRLNAEKAIKKTEKAAEDSIKAGNKLLRIKEEFKKNWDKAKSKYTSKFNGDVTPRK